MKANQSVENYDSRIREYANYSFRQSRNICKTIGKREAGSENEIKLQQHVENELKTCADEVKVDEFNFQKDYKIFQNKVGAIFFICAAALLLAMLLLGIEILGLISAAVAVVGIVLSFAGKIYAPKKLSSKNVYAVKKPTGETKNRLILVSNADCIRTTKLDGVFLKIMSIISAVLSIAISVLIYVQKQNEISITDTQIYKYLAIPVVVFMIFNIIILFSSYTGVLDGANKNLSGIFTSIAVLKYLKDMSISMQSTEIMVLVTGAHEADLSGVKNFVKKHLEELKNVETRVVCLDCLRDEKNLRIETKNIRGKVAEEIKNCAKENGAEIEIQQNTFLSDGVVFENHGFDGCTLTASEKDVMTQEDTYEDMKIKTIETALKSVMEEVFYLG